jgi:MYXO-CTERM domain-containing protein
MPSLKTLPVVLCVLAAVTTRGEAAVVFENTGTLTGWSRVYVQEQGTNTMVSTPTFQGPSAIKSTQTFVVADGRGYHSERVMFDIQRNGQDYYYGLALYLPPDWVFHDQNVTFQQWAFENPGGGGPWILMFVQNDKLRMGGSGASGSRDLATITNLRGTWIRIVTRINMTASGPFEVWVNGTKTTSAPINLVVGGEPPTIRWSTGIYCTAWRTQQPAGGSPISVWHDHLRVATTYGEAEPANWGNPSLVDAGAADGPATPDAAGSDGDSDSGSAGAGGASGSGGGGGSAAAGAGGSDAGGGAGATGGASGGAGAGGAAMGGRAGSGGRGGATAGRGGTGAAPGPAQEQSGCACAVGSRGGAPPGPLLLVVLAVAALAQVVRRRSNR